MKFPLIFLTLLLGLHIRATFCAAKVDICVSDPMRVNHVQGRVVAHWNGGEEPIPNAKVELKEFQHDEWRPKFKVTTDEKGCFRVADVPSGRYEMDVRSPNFNSFGTRILVNRSKSNTDEEVVVSLTVGLHECGSAKVQRITGR